MGYLRVLLANFGYVMHITAPGMSNKMSLNVQVNLQCACGKSYATSNFVTDSLQQNSLLLRGHTTK